LSYWDVAGAGANWSILSLCLQSTDLPAPFSLAGVFVDAFNVLPIGIALLGLAVLNLLGRLGVSFFVT
jgi:Zn-dependent membrane protease YugP